MHTSLHLLLGKLPTTNTLTTTLNSAPSSTQTTAKTRQRASHIRNVAEFWCLTEGSGRSMVALESNGRLLLVSAAGGWPAWCTCARREVVLVLVVVAYLNLVYAPISSILRFSLVVLRLLSLPKAVVAGWLWLRVRRRVMPWPWEDGPRRVEAVGVR